MANSNPTSNTDHGDENFDASDVHEEVQIEDGDGDQPMDDDDNWTDVPEEPEVTEVEAHDEDVFIDDSIQGFFSHNSEPVFSIAVHPNNTTALTGGGDDKGYLWRLDNGQTVAELPGHSDSVVAVAFSTDGQYAATGGMDGKVQVFKSENGESVATLDGPSEVTWLQWHPRGPVLLAGSQDGTLWMWQLPAGTCLNVFSGHLQSVTCGGFTPDGKTVVSGSEDGHLIVWDPKTAAPKLKLTPEDRRFEGGSLTSLAFSEDSNLVLTGSAEGKVRLVHIVTGKILAAFDDHMDSVESIAFSKSMPLAATASVDHTIGIWDLQSLRLRHTLRHDDTVTKVAWHPTQPFVFSASVDRTLRLWDARTGECLKVWKGHQDGVLDMAVVGDGTKIVTASDDGTALVFGM